MSWRPPPTIGLRLTAWYAGLALVGGAVLLALSLLLALHQIDVYPRQVNSLASDLAKRPAFSVPQKRGRPRQFEDLPTPSELRQLTAGRRRARATAEDRVTVSSKRTLVLEMAGLLAGFALVAVGTGAIVTRRALAPIARITSTARRVSATSLGERLRLEGPPDELKELADTFDAMLDRVEQALERERSFIANASHELRTPLAIIRAELDAARSGERPLDPAAARSFEVIEAAATRSGRLLESLFALARASRRSIEPAPVDLRELVIEELREREAQARDRRLSLRRELAPARVDADPTLLAQLVANLLDNALRYTPAGGSVAIVTAMDADVAVLEVENDGPAITPADAARLAEPFVRGAPASDGEDGLGLGLSLAEAVVRSHDGTLQLHARAPGGLRVTVRLPSAPAEALDSAAEVRLGAAP